MKKCRLSRTGVYVILVCVFLLAVNALLGHILTNQSKSALTAMISNRMLDISNTAAAMIDGDVLSSVQAEDQETPEYRGILKTLAYFQDNIDLKYIYCIRDLGNKNFVFTIDPADDPGAFGEPVVYTDALYQASLGTPSVDKKPYEDSWGRFYSAYTPVFDSAGKVAGIVAVDFSADWFDRQIFRAFATTLMILVVSLVFGTAIVVLVTSRARKRYRKIYSELNGVSEGIETLVREATSSSGAKPTPRQEAPGERSPDEITAIGDKIRSLQEALGKQISFVRAQTYIDGLTGLENRTAYLEKIAALEKQAADGGADFAVAVFDLNGLKKLNDSLGHEKGDQAIAAAGAVLRKTFPDGRLYRIGGDEFIAILQKTEAEMDALFDQFDQNLAAQNAGETSFQIAMSKGCAVRLPDDREYRAVFNRADDAMYEDKANFYMARVNSQVTGTKHTGDHGAMDVDYRQFATLFEYIENIKKRFKHPFELVMISLEEHGGKEPPPEELEKAMAAMEQSIRQTIRNVDVLTRYSRQQFLVILLGSNPEGVQIAMERIFHGFFAENGKSAFTPSYAVIGMDE